MKRAIFTFYNLSLDPDIVRLQAEVVKKFNTTSDFLPLCSNTHGEEVIHPDAVDYGFNQLFVEKQYDTAQKKHNIPGALKALELIQKVRGNKSSNEIEISVESLEENIVDCLNRISTEKVKELLLKSSHSKIILQLESNIEQHQQHQEKIKEELQ